MTHERLARAELALGEMDNQQPLGAVATSCPLKETSGKYRIEVHVMGEDDQPLADVAVVLRRTSREESRGVTDDAGNCVFAGLDEGGYEVSLVGLDQDAWDELLQIPLPQVRDHRSDCAIWRPSSEESAGEEFDHTVVRGECVSTIADHYGFFPITIWHYKANLELRKRRHDNQYILNPGDKIVIPPKRLKEIPVATGKRVVLQRKGVPDRLRLRFIDHYEAPRIGIPYLLSVVTRNKDAVPLTNGETDSEGIVDRVVPPECIRAQVILRPGKSTETYTFLLGCVNSIDTIAGIQARLNNLGYDCGTEDGLLQHQTREAIRDFQRNRNLSETGDPDEQLQKALYDVARY